MTAPRSDTATIEARRNRLLELLSEGKTEVQASSILRDEGYPASDLTVRRDVQTLAPAWREANLETYSAHAERQFNELVALKSALTDPAISKDRRIVLALQILDREMDLLGTKAPSKSVTAHITNNTAVQYRFLEHAHGLSEGQVEEVFRFMDALPRRTVSIADCFVNQKALPTAAELVDPVEFPEEQNVGS
jgi:hypothetical protein